jgi:flagellar biosynthesis/type III secretory pathway protein FliH
MAAAEFDFAPLAAPVADAPVVDPLETAAAELEALRAAAVSEGFQAGRAEALQALAPAVAALEQAAAALDAERAALAVALEEEAVDLALAIAERVVAGVVAVEPERVVEAVRGALRGITDRSRVTVLVNPDDLELVRGAADELRATLGGIEHLEVQAERRVGRGGAVVRHPEGDVDASVATKLQRVRELVEVRSSAGEAPRGGERSETG